MEPSFWTPRAPLSPCAATIVTRYRYFDQMNIRIRGKVFSQPALPIFSAEKTNLGEGGFTIVSMIRPSHFTFDLNDKRGMSLKDFFYFEHCPKGEGGGRPLPVFSGPFSPSAFLVNKKSLSIF